MDPIERVTELESENARLRVTIADLTEKLQAMEQRLSAMNRRLFGTSSERFHEPGQQHVELGDGRPFVDAAAAVEAPAATPDDGASQRSPTRRTKRRPRLPVHIEVIDRVIDVPAHERVDADGTALRHLSDEVSERLHYIPSHFQRQRIIRPVYGHPFSEHAERAVAPAPAFLVAKGLPTDELAVQVVVSKYADHLPLYRQSAMWARQDVHLSRSTLCGWVGAVCARLKPVWEAIGNEVRGERYLHLDDTPIRVLAPDRCHIGRLWTYGIGDAVHLRYTPTRAGCWPSDFLRDYRGFVVGDAYSGHHALFDDGKRIDIGCWAHVRRNFEKIHKQQPSEPESANMLGRIRVLYRIESDLRNTFADEDRIHVRRLRDALPTLNDIKQHLDRLVIAETPKSPLYKAAAYALGQWTACIRYADSGFLPIDNNLAERSLRPIAVGRKNYLFLGSGEEGGGDWAAIAYSVIGSCRLNGLDPYRYLLDIAPLITTPGFADHASITPRNWAKKKAAHAA